MVGYHNRTMSYGEAFTSHMENGAASAQTIQMMSFKSIGTRSSCVMF